MRLARRLRAGLTDPKERERLDTVQARLFRIRRLPSASERWKYPNDMLADWAALNRRGR